MSRAHAAVHRYRFSAKIPPRLLEMSFCAVWSLVCGRQVVEALKIAGRNYTTFSFKHLLSELPKTPRPPALGLQRGAPVQIDLRGPGHALQFASQSYVSAAHDHF